AHVRFVIVGGAAAVAHGSARLTQDLDVVYARDPANLARIVEALEPHRPYLRGAPPGLPFIFDARTLANGLNFNRRLKDLEMVAEREEILESSRSSYPIT